MSALSSAFVEFFKQIVTLLTNMNDVLTNTASRIDAIDFKETVFHEYMGYAAYVMGEPLYTLFMSVILISIGVSMWSFFIKAIQSLRNFIL